ncbi:unnamed protein product [Peronospora destructor]|uniref:Uncharacterized protein n=1 Tax=Peronospora destructor TaxID=86335 RepID=A0AAV0UQA0_9STRA|nr:unnamed protein product [Peronospora destructor]
MDAMKDQWITGERLSDFAQQDGNVACFEFKPKVWKYTEDMTQGKCKRRNVKYYVQFEAFVQMVAGDHRYYACIGSGMSTSFEVGSSRVLARQKRKAATSAVEAANTSSQSDMTFMQAQQLMTHSGNPLMHNVMATHPFRKCTTRCSSRFLHRNSSKLTQSSSSQLLLGEKRKLSSERLAFPTDRSAKMLKPMSGVPQPI